MTSQTLCTKLWNYAVVDLAKKRIRTCCKTPSIQLTTEDIQQYQHDVFLNLPQIVTDRQTMLDGGKPKRCNHCWGLESQGIESFRDSAESWNQYFSSLNYLDPTKSYHPNNLDIQLDNYCDFKCIYCSEEFSSQWQSERERFGDIKNYIPIHSDSEEFTKLFFSWFDTVKMSFERIAFLGGEPLISPKFYQYLETVINSYGGNFPPNLEFYIITNLNTKENYFNKFIKTIESYKDRIKFNINVSMEASGIRAETIRHGLDYDRFVSNFDRLASIPEITITNITSLNVFCLSTLSEHLSLVTSLEKKYNRQIDIHENLVTWPRYLHINLMRHDLGTKYVQDSVSVLKDTGHDSYITFLNNLVDGFKFNELQNTPIHKNLKQELETLGARRNINYQEIFNEYKYIWT